ncbi:MAG TPA: homoserine dehydrogenase [Anaerolineales bacterium]|nr:homoserine dehydrogenase [Anaerolineales bacterium]
MIKTIRISLNGFGNVGQGLAMILAERADELADLGLIFTIVSVHTRSRGSVYQPAGLPIGELLTCANSDGLNQMEGIHDYSIEQVLQQGETDVLVEVSPTNLADGQPATDIIRTALQCGKHVVTANKGPVSLYFAELQALAQQNQVQFRAEGTVMAGTPSILLAEKVLTHAGLSGIQGILNGTTNYILTEMEKGMSYTDALAQAQALGYAETDPTGDVEGYDAAGKLIILANILFGKQLSLEQIDRTGITGISRDDIANAQQANQRWPIGTYR